MSVLPVVLLFLFLEQAVNNNPVAASANNDLFVINKVFVMRNKYNYCRQIIKILTLQKYSLKNRAILLKHSIRQGRISILTGCAYLVISNSPFM